MKWIIALMAFASVIGMITMVLLVAASREDDRADLPKEY